MKTYTVKKVVHFCYAHRLVGHPHCDALHGHNGVATIEATAEHLHGPWGFVIDFGELKSLVKVYDHSGEIVFVSAEVLAAQVGQEVRRILREREQAPLKVKVTIEETPGSEATWEWTA